MKVMELGVFEAKTHLSELIQRVQQGQVYRITKRGVPVAELRPIGLSKARLTRGCAASDGYWMAADFKATPGDFHEYVK